MESKHQEHMQRYSVVIVKHMTNLVKHSERSQAETRTPLDPPIRDLDSLLVTDKVCSRTDQGVEESIKNCREHEETGKTSPIIKQKTE